MIQNPPPTRCGNPRMVGCACSQMGLSTRRVRNVNHSETIAAIREFGPDILLSYSCPYKIQKPILDIPTIGCLNVHSSLLPAYAGICTYIHVLAHGEKTTGISIHEMLEKFDSGRIVNQASVNITPGISVLGLFSELSKMAGPMMVHSIDQIFQAGRIEGADQDLSFRTYFGEPSRADISRLRKNGYHLIKINEMAKF